MQSGSKIKELIKKQPPITSCEEDFEALHIPAGYELSPTSEDYPQSFLEELGWDKADKDLKTDYILTHKITNPATGYWYHGSSLLHYNSIKAHGLDSDKRGKPINFGAMENNQTCFSADFYISRYFAPGKDGIVYRTPMSDNESKTCNKLSVLTRKQATLAENLECCLDNQGTVWYSVSGCSLKIIQNYLKTVHSDKDSKNLYLVTSALPKSDAVQDAQSSSSAVIHDSKIKENLSKKQKLKLKILSDKGYWQTKHTTGLRLPKGIKDMQGYLEKNDWSAIERIALQQLSPSNSSRFFKRDFITTQLYEYLSGRTAKDESDLFRSIEEDYNRYLQKKIMYKSNSGWRR